MTHPPAGPSNPTPPPGPGRRADRITTAALLARAVALIAVGLALIAIGLASLSAPPAPAPEREPRWMRPATPAEEREWQIRRLVDLIDEAHAGSK
ncbi:hypothetical protein [Salinispora vitiensis]|uniref:hypothetical protein n=1 Tax=Salinispora vitiensis TaxID=999544 RepID=UPI00037466DF|nr:hypothetical protein [Salinispora vitiensis]